MGNKYKKKRKVIKVCVCSNRNPHQSVWSKVIDLAMYPRVQLPDGEVEYVFKFQLIGESLIHTARNKACFIDTTDDNTWFDYLMFVDDDMEWGSNDWIAILASYDRPIIGGLCVRRSYPHRPTVFVRDPKTGRLHIPIISPKMQEIPRHKAILPVEGIGMGFTMIKREVFSNLAPPYFGFGNYVPVDADGRPDEEASQYMGEDIYFCQRAKQAGFDVYCDFGMWVGHIGDYTFDIRDYYRALEERAEDIHKATGKRIEDTMQIEGIVTDGVDQGAIRDADTSPTVPAG